MFFDFVLLCWLGGAAFGGAASISDCRFSRVTFASSTISLSCYDCKTGLVLHWPQDTRTCAKALLSLGQICKFHNRSHGTEVLPQNVTFPYFLIWFLWFCHFHGSDRWKCLLTACALTALVQGFQALPQPQRNTYHNIIQYTDSICETFKGVLISLE